jgi:probable HAF family extracellular repeat protein
MPMYTFTTIDNPAANGVTVAVDINNADQIVGYYIDAAMKSHGFLLSGGVFTTLDDPLAGPQGTFANGINAVGQVVGYYQDTNNLAHGFLYDPVHNPSGGGTYTTVDDPLATRGTLAFDINAAGQIVGYYADGTGFHGFLRSNNGSFITLDDPAGVGRTFPQSINDAGQIVGSYSDANNAVHSFLYSNGTFTTLDDPVAVNGTFAEGINTGQISGDYNGATTATASSTTTAPSSPSTIPWASPRLQMASTTQAGS